MNAKVISFPKYRKTETKNRVGEVGELSIEKRGKRIGCSHNKIEIISDDYPYVQCSDCGEQISSTSVLARIASETTRLERIKTDYLDAIKKYEARKRFTCKACSKVQFID